MVSASSWPRPLAAGYLRAPQSQPPPQRQRGAHAQVSPQAQRAAVTVAHPHEES